MLLYVGRMAREKDLSTLLRAFAILQPRCTNSSLAMIGDGPLKTILQRQAVELGIDRNVLWIGSLELNELRGWYAAAVATLLPSLHEGFGKVIAESFLMGTPVIVTPFVSAGELVIEGETGFIVPFRNHDLLARKCEELLCNSQKAIAMGNLGRQHIIDYLPSEHEYLNRLVDIWEQSSRFDQRGIDDVQNSIK